MQRDFAATNCTSEILNTLIQYAFFPKDTASPFPLSKNSINLVYKPYDISVSINEGILDYMLNQFLINIGIFKTCRMIAMPIPLGNNN
jgi:hypothetical protein